MTNQSKSVLRTLVLSLLLASASAAASAAEPAFLFQPDRIVLELDSPRTERWPPRGWGREDFDATRPIFGARDVEAAAEPELPAVEPEAAGFLRIAAAAPLAQRSGRAGWRGQEFDGRLTATGERFDMFRLTAASADLPLNSLVSVSNPATGETVVVRINDRQPAAAGQVLVLSMAAAARLGVDEAPDATVTVRYVGEAAPAPMQVASR